MSVPADAPLGTVSCGDLRREPDPMGARWYFDVDGDLASYVWTVNGREVGEGPTLHGNVEGRRPQRAPGLRCSLF